MVWVSPSIRSRIHFANMRRVWSSSTCCMALQLAWIDHSAGSNSIKSFALLGDSYFSLPLIWLSLPLNLSLTHYMVVEVGRQRCSLTGMWPYLWSDLLFLGSFAFPTGKLVHAIGRWQRQHLAPWEDGPPSIFRYRTYRGPGPYFSYASIALRIFIRCRPSLNCGRRFSLFFYLDSYLSRTGSSAFARYYLRIRLTFSSALVLSIVLRHFPSIRYLSKDTSQEVCRFHSDTAWIIAD